MNITRINPVDYFNFNVPFTDIFKDDKAAHMKSEREACYPNPSDLSDSINNPTFVLSDSNQVNVMKENAFDIAKGSIISKFMLFTEIKFKGDYRAAESYVLYKLMKLEVPYMRVGTDYYKIISKPNRWGGKDSVMKGWKKEAMSDDHTKNIFKVIPKFDDFVIVPDNQNYQRTYDNCYNLYSPFPHKEYDAQVSPADIPHSLGVMKHIFGEKLEEGLIYMKVLYEYPKQMLPVIVLISTERGTGKTTFLDWMYILFGDNVTTVNPENLSSEFNGSYATKNILLFEETLIEKAAGVEKIKALTTAKMVTVRNLYASAYTVPFFGKIIMCTNKVYDFIKIDQEENRFWTLYISPVTGRKNTRIDLDLHAEAPKFLRYLRQLPAVDLTQDRLVLTADRLVNKHLVAVKEESKSWLRKEIELHLEEFFNNNPSVNEFMAASIDIKNEWFVRDNQIKASYISKVIRQEIRLQPEKNQRYFPFAKTELAESRVSTPFVFKRTTPAIQPESRTLVDSTNASHSTDQEELF